MLRLAEHGGGPTIEIEWPRTSSARIALEQVLRRCYGMRDAHLLPDGRLTIDPGGAETESSVDAARYSRLVRLPGGGAGSGQRSLAGAISVRVFPRRLDAALVGALARLPHPSNGVTQTITGRYHRQGNMLSIVDLRVDGVGALSEIALAPSGGSCPR